MRKLFRIFLLLVCCLSITPSCVKEDWGEGVPEGEPVDLVLNFGAPEQGLISTKATLRTDQESTIFNLYVFIFDGTAERQKIYGKYFDANNLGDASASDYWTVNNYKLDQESGKYMTTGSVHIKTIARNNCTIVLICNIDAEMVNISPEQLGTVQTYNDLYNQKATLNQLIVSRSGYFPMTGEVSGFNIGGADANKPNIVLQRQDAKIQFNVRVAPGSEISDFVPLKWQVINIPKRAWVLERGHYQNGAYSQASLIDATGDSADDYFNLPEMNFETQAMTTDENGDPEYYKGKEPINTSDPGVRVISHGFSFYMMENRKAPKSHTGWTYEDRERQVKDNDADRAAFPGMHVGDFKYAPDRATYVIITGQITMSNQEYQPSENTSMTEAATLSADVRYIIHLGDFSNERYDDFNIFRNHTYTYDISILSANDIKLEVKNNEQASTAWNEPEPGASGRVTVAMEEVFPCDAHYASHIIKFHADYIDPEKVTWRVQTPFNPSGASPEVTVDANGVVKDNTAGIDFEWVEFRVNWEEETEETAGHFYDNARSLYKPMAGKQGADGKTMNISGLVDYLKTQTRLWRSSDPDVKATSDFYKAWQQGYKDVDNGGPYIPVTAFVNEYYYEVNPITKKYEPELWKSFVNKGIRYMYILSDSRISADGESEVIGSSFTIQQKSIQTIYNVSHPNLVSAWGCEHEDDEEEAHYHKYWKNGNKENRGNTSLTDGRRNSLKEWELLNANGTVAYLGKPNLEVDYWNRYMDLTANNTVPLMRDEYQYLRYSCLSRNRDNNGNGVIDEDEVRWYMGATNQLIGLFMGDYGLEGDARLYQRTRQQQESVDKYDWRQHVLASTCYGSNSNSEPRTIWAEQCLTGSTINMSYSYAGGMDRYSTRCLRNLGAYTDENGQVKDITYAPVVPPSGQQAVEAENYIQVTRIRDGVRNYTGKYDSNVYYEFDCSRINEKSLRYYTNRELVMHDEHGEQACLYKKFQAAPVKDAPTFAEIACNKMNENIDKNIEENPYCPPGYRLCNIREASVLRDFIPSSDKEFHISYNFTRTYWSYGVLGDLYDTRRTGTDMSKSYAFGTSPQKVLMTELDKQKTKSIRCVKDIKD